jgi:hypothetical protein
MTQVNLTTKKGASLSGIIGREHVPKQPGKSGNLRDVLSKPA